MMPKLPPHTVMLENKHWRYAEKYAIEYARAVAEACIEIFRKEAEDCDEDVPLDSFVSACSEKIRDAAKEIGK